LPFSLFLSAVHPNPWARFRSRKLQQKMRTPQILQADSSEFQEQSPVAALILQWFSSVLLIALTATLSPVSAYTFLVSLYGYVFYILVGALLGGGLLYLKLDSHSRNSRGRQWGAKVAFIPWLNPLHVIVYSFATTFLLFAAFVGPTKASPYIRSIQGYPWWIIPTIGLSSLLCGVVWWLGLRGIQWYGRRELVVTRTPFLAQEDGDQFVVKAELVTHEWRVRGDADDGWGT